MAPSGFADFEAGFSIKNALQNYIANDLNLEDVPIFYYGDEFDSVTSMGTPIDFGFHFNLYFPIYVANQPENITHKMRGYLPTLPIEYNNLLYVTSGRQDRIPTGRGAHIFVIE